MVIVKDGKILYNKSENNLSPGQKMTIRYFARRQGKDVNEALQNYSFITKAPIASNTKWLSTAAVTCPGLFGSFPWIDNTRKYAGFLFVVNLKQNNRYEIYTNLKAIIDKAIDNSNH